MKWLSYLLFALSLSFIPAKAHAQIGPYPCGANSSVTTWRNDYAYSIGQVVILNGVTYQSLANTNIDQNPCTFSGTLWTNIINGSGGGGGGSVIPATPNVLKGSGVVSISVPAIPGADYLLPTGSAAGLTNFPIFNQSTTGQSGTALALATAPTLCATGSAPTGVLANGNATGCAPVTTATIPATTSLLKGSGSLGVSIAAIANIDYLTPTGSAAGLTSFPTFNQNTTGNAATSTVTGGFSSTPSLCPTGQAPVGILPNGNATSCQLLGGGATIPPTILVLKGTGTPGVSQSAVPNTDYVIPSITINGHPLSSNVVISASDITTGTLPHAQLPTLLSGDIPNNAANTSGTASNLSGTPALPNGTTATTQTVGDNTARLATDAFVIANAIGAPTPNTNLLLAGNNAANSVRAGVPGTDYVYPFMFNGMGSQGQATSSTNFGSNQFQLTGSCWDGTTHQNDFFASGSVPAANGPGALMLNVWNHYGGCNSSALGIFTYPISMGNGLSAFNVDAKYFGAYGDAFSPIDGCITSNSSNVLNCNGPFISTLVDGGKDIWVHGAGAAGVAFHSTIVSVTDANHAVMAATPSISLTNTPGNTVYGHDDTAKIQACFQFSANNSLPCALIPAQNPPGQGLQGFLVGSAGLQLVSASSGGEVSATNFYGSSQVHGTNIFCEFNGDCLSEAAGRIQGANISNIEFLGDPTQPNGRGMHFVAAPGIFGDGGLWQSNITNVNVESFTQECLLSEAGGGPGYGFNLPFQIDNFYQFFCQAPNQMHTANLIKMVGQTAQIAFFGGQANGPGSEANQPNAMILITEKTSGLSDTPTDVKFFGYTYEVGTIGLQLGEGAYNIHYDNSYVENVATPLIAGGTGGVYGLTYNGNHMANSGNGTAVAQFTGGVTGSMRDNLVYGGTTPGAFAICTNTGNQIDFGSGNNSSVNTITGCTPTIAVSAAGSPLAANTCTSASTATVTGVYTTARVDVTFSGDPTAITGWGATGGMVIDAWPSAKDTVSYKLCNQTPSPITYGAITFNVDFK